jgi:hypothetical protein
MSKANEEPRLLDGFEEELITWDTDELLKALTATGDLYTDSEISSIQGELSKRGFALPLKCPVCSLINPRPTQECPVCGHNFSEATSTIPAEVEHQLCSRCHRANDKKLGECAYCGHALDSALQTTRMLQDNEEQIEALARRALKGSLMCLLFPGYSLFLAPLVVGRAMDTLSALSELHKRYPDHALEASAKTRAITALLLGSVVFLVNVVLVIIFLWAIWS